MLAEIYSGGVLGVDAYLVEVEVDVLRAQGDQVRFNVVGLPELCRYHASRLLVAPTVIAVAILDGE